jgi:hypothetical protein
MILTTTLATDGKGNITAAKSAYNPSKTIKDLTQAVLKDFQQGFDIMNTPYREFNDKSLLERQSEDQKSFNAYVEPASQDPDDAWKSTAFRPIVRNRVISIAAHVTGSLIFPVVEAQNPNDQEDKDAATVMADLMEWSAEQSDYEKTFLYGVLAALVNPAVIIQTEYAETYRTIKDIQDNGSWKEKQVLDDALSGFKDGIVPLDELFIGDVYEADIQRQPFLVRRKAIDYTLASAKYGDNANFKSYVRPGLQIMFAEATDSFYEQYDESLQDRLVEEVTYYNRSKDLQLCFINGVLVTDPDQPNPRKDKKYPFAKTGYESFDEGKFFYYKSLVFKMAKDEEVVNTLYRMVIDGTFLRLMPPTVQYGEEDITSSVVTPGTITRLSKDSKLEAINVGSDINAGYNALEKVEQSLSETSSAPLQAGQRQAGEPPTAFQLSREEQNARVMLGLFGKMIGFLVKQYGELRISDILQFLTVGDIDEIAGSGSTLKYRSFLLPDRTSNGKKKSRRIKFDPYLPSDPISEDELLEQSFAIMDEEGGLDSSVEIYKANPVLFRKNKFKLKVTPDVITPPSDNVRKALMLEEYDRAIASPLANQEALYRDLLLGAYDATKHDTDKYIVKQPALAPAGAPGSKKGGLAEVLASPGKPGGNNELMSKVA